MNNKVIILRGIPGCGKSTFAKTLDCPIVSADEFFINPKTGEYEFDVSKLGEAHQSCMCKFLNLLMEGEETICVDNTAIHLWEINSYKAAAELVGYVVETHEWIPGSKDDVKACYERNSHGVPLPTFLNMWYEFEISIDTRRVFYHSIQIVEDED